MSVTPNIITGDTIIKNNLNNRYGNGKLTLDSGILSIKEITTPTVPSSTFDNVFVDTTSKNLRIQNNSNVVKDVGINRIPILLPVAGINITGAISPVFAPTIASNIILPVLNATPKKFTLIITNSNAAARNIRIQVLNLGPQGLSGPVIIFDNGVGGVAQAGTTTVTYNCVPVSYPSTDSVISFRIGRSGVGIRLNYIYVDY